jgi:hypothetical protein
MHRMAILAAVLAAVLAGSASASTTVTIYDHNSTASFDPTSDAGLYEWLVDGTSHMYQQWFWYRVGATGGESPISDLALLNSLTTDTNGDGDHDTLFLSYGGQGFRIDIAFMLMGGSTGSGTADLAETIRIVNTSKTQSLDMHFFQYVDFDINGLPDSDTVQITGGNTARQTKGYTFVAETVVTPVPSHYSVAEFDRIYAALTDDDPTTLDDNGGPITGDATWAFQWDATIGPGRTLLISKDKNIVPEPATLALLGGGLALAAVTRRRSR